MSKGLLVVVSGPSGVGKGTIIRELQKEMPELGFSVSATTRHPRPGEIEGIDYFFISQEEFKNRIKEQQFLEWAKVHDDYYGTPRSFIEARLASNQDVILDIDVQGGMQVRKSFPQGLFIFIVPPTFDELRVRLNKRKSEKEEDIEQRLADAKEEFSHMQEYDYLVSNRTLAHAVEDVRCIIIAERCKTFRNLQEMRNDLSAH